MPFILDYTLLAASAHPPVLGFSSLHVRTLDLADVGSAHLSWLQAGWGGSPPGSPRVVGLDTEFVGSELALVQLCCGDRALLVQVPRLRQKQQLQGGSGGSGDGGGGDGARPASGAALQHRCPRVLRALLQDHLPKAAAEVWQDALLLFSAFGCKLRNGLDLTAACPLVYDEYDEDDADDGDEGCRKLPLFEIFRGFFPDSELTKDKSINHKDWFPRFGRRQLLSKKQIKYAALDAFVSYAAGVGALRRPGDLPPAVDLCKPEHWQVVAAAQVAAVAQHLAAASAQDRQQHDFHEAKFVRSSRAGTVRLQTRGSRFRSRLRRGVFAEATLVDGRRIKGMCVSSKGKTAQLGDLRWADSGAPVDMWEVAEVERIEMDEHGAETVEEVATKALLADVLTGEVSLAGFPLAAALFSGGADGRPATSRGGTAPARPPLPPTAAVVGGGVAAGLAALLRSAFSAAVRGVSAFLAAVRGVPMAAQLFALQLFGRINSSQRAALHGLLLGDEPVQLVQGPPGTGKTTVISQAVWLWLLHNGHLSSRQRSTAISQRAVNGHLATVVSRAVWLWLQNAAPPRLPGASEEAREALACVAGSNVAARNIELSLLKLGLGAQHFRLVVSNESYFEWHAQQYGGQLKDVLITSDQLEDLPTGAQYVREYVASCASAKAPWKQAADEALGKRGQYFASLQVVVTTVSMLASPKFSATMLHGKVLTRLMVDEASQIYAGDLLLPLVQYGQHLRSLSLFGDDMQLPPYGSEWDGAQLQPSAYPVGPPLPPPAAGHVRRNMLTLSYRLPPALCAFISDTMYGGLLRSGRKAAGRPAVRWVDVQGREEKLEGTSWSNEAECEAACGLARRGFQGSSWTVLTGYDKQRWLLSKGVVQRGSGGERVYNIDTFQGREDEVVIVSLVRRGDSLGFMVDDRRVNVMLTRCGG
ncbi:ATP-dependent helicase NAM7 [Tetrabaena socialis]|uniref:ATP-dependent helicase NAM7 n=1 Tax=Tetrabaena socialis TaxID=47790 RepID=A0A2J7ZYR3_9CHLO|nr:ATP-dependent helicase NAM7 [Tetrabaena socialis]|eukprot:PNH05409.1 ATP-dependent helicase NAM7 [Tetrabaena socialis]